MFVTSTAFADFNNKLNKISSFTPSDNPNEIDSGFGFFDRMGAAFDHQKYAMNSNSRSNAFADEIETDLKALRPLMEKDGLSSLWAKTLSNYFDSNDAFFVGNVWGETDNERKFWEHYDNLRELYPEANARPRDEILKSVSEKAARLRKKTEFSNNSFTGGAGDFAGTAMASIVDPVNLITGIMSLPFGGPAAKGATGFAKMALTSAVSNMATEVLIQPGVKRFQNELGNEYTIGDAAMQVGSAGAFGAAFPLGAEGIKGAYKGIKSVVKKYGLKANIKIRAAEQGIASNAFIESTIPYEAPDAGAQIHHEQHLAQKIDDVVQGNDIVDDVRQLRWLDESIVAPLGKKPGYLQMKMANIHPTERHLKEIQAVGFNNVNDYADFIAQNFDRVYKDEQNPGRFFFVVSKDRLNAVGRSSKTHAENMVIEALLVKDTGIFDVVTAFPKKERDFKNKKNLLSGGMPNRHLTESAPEALTRQKQVLNNTIAFNGKNVQRANVGNYNITTQYDIVDLADLKTSDAVDYPVELQPRDRTRQASREQVGDMARHLNPEQLGRHTDADRGAPIVGPDGFVESGNGRTMAIRQAYAENPEAAAGYRFLVEKEAADMGVDVSGMKQPVLIRRRLTDLSPDERLSFVRDANKASSLAYSIAETAALDAEKLDGGLLSLYMGGDLKSQKNTEFVRHFRTAAVSDAERASFMTAEGLLSVDGEKRIQAALFAKAYGSKDLARLMFESENNIKAIGRGMLDASAEFSKLKEDIAAGRVDKKFDISNDIVEAVNAVRNARLKEIPLIDYIAQMDLFAKDKPRLKELLKAFFRDENLRRPVAADKVGDMLMDYAKSARNQRADQLSMFDLSQSPDDILNAHFDRMKKEDVLNGADAKAAADTLSAEETIKAAAVDKEVLDAKRAIEGFMEDEKAIMTAYANEVDLAEKLLMEATTCRA